MPFEAGQMAWKILLNTHEAVEKNYGKITSKWWQILIADFAFLHPLLIAPSIQWSDEKQMAWQKSG